MAFISTISEKKIFFHFIEFFCNPTIICFRLFSLQAKYRNEANLNCNIQLYFGLKQNVWKLLQLIAILFMPCPLLSLSHSIGSFAVIFACCTLYFKSANKSVSITVKLFCEHEKSEKTVEHFFFHSRRVYEIFKWLTKLYSSSLLLSPHLYSACINIIKLIEHNFFQIECVTGKLLCK